MLIKLFKSIGVISLVIFSFYYTDRSMSYLRNNDPLMQEIIKVEEKYKTQPVSAVIEEEFITPGLNGKKVNTKKSYYNMKSANLFIENALIFNEIIPANSVTVNHNKYIRWGNEEKNAISLIFLVKETNNLEEILKILDSKKAPATFFVDGYWLENNMPLAYQIIHEGHEVQNYGYNGKYEKDSLKQTNLFVRELLEQTMTYCISLSKNKEILSSCAKEKMHTLIPQVIAYEDHLYNIKKKISPGRLIVFKTNDITIDYLAMTIKFINSKGYNILKASNHLSEK